VFDTQINIGKTNISTNVLPELDHNNSISAENISNKVTVDKVKQATLIILIITNIKNV